MAAPAPKYGNPGFSISRRIATAKVKEFTIIDAFTLGYRNREDLTKLPPGVLIQGSQNVLTSVLNTVGIIPGYTLDGQSANESFLLWETEVGGLGFLLLESGGKIILTP